MRGGDVDKLIAYVDIVDADKTQRDSGNHSVCVLGCVCVCVCAFMR